MKTLISTPRAAGNAVSQDLSVRRVVRPGVGGVLRCGCDLVPSHAQPRRTLAGLATACEVGISDDSTRDATGHSGSACFNGSAGTATFTARLDSESSAALGPPPPFTDVPGRLRYGYQVWQERRQQRGRLIADLRGRVQSAGLAGVSAMVILNSAYYTGAFLLLWTMVLCPPRGLGAAGATQRIAQTLGIVYVASISSKVPRAAAMLLLAPGLNRVMLKAQQAMGLKSQRQVFGVLLAVCLGTFFSALSTVLFLWL